nr:immunoglobulin light chain junction region [Macaca mulatta]MOX42255.1 immunoglobulin light chain junction region [Macaca mulatta]MOX42497.1 immunoglobulin light chain junction region [Macaca mulatta]MOX43318.1 immunoglobulin light chain junction region [Macaca mulatta]MOX43901.1 immunoglobulin light chain junction region [Macaca mulatta]
DYYCYSTHGSGNHWVF